MDAIDTAVNTGVAVAPVVVANGSKLAVVGRAALTGAKFVGSAALSGLIIGTGTGITVVVAGGTIYGIFKGAGWLADKVSSKMEERASKKSQEKEQMAPAPA